MPNSLKKKKQLTTHKKTFFSTFFNAVSMPFTYHTAVAMTSCCVFLSGASMGSPSKPPATMPPANTTSIVLSQHDMGCLREKVWAPDEEKELLENKMAIEAIR